MAKPKEDGCCGCCLSCLGGAFIKKALATSGFMMFVLGTLVKKTLVMSSLIALTSGFLVKKALMTCCLLSSSLLVFVGSTLIKEVLAVSGLLFFVSSLLLKMVLAGRCLEEMVLDLPHGVDCSLPIPVVAFCTGASPMENGPPGWFRRQQLSGLLVFAKCLLEPFFVVKGMTNVGRGIVVLIP